MSQLKVNAISDAAGANGNAITLATDGTCTAKITNNLSNRNLIINGSMQVAERGTSSTTAGFSTLDRWKTSVSGVSTATVTQSQQSTTSSDTPWDYGFRNYWRHSLDQAGSVAAGTYCFVKQDIEARNVANSGWDYESASSYITLSFWVRASSAMTYYGTVMTLDGTRNTYPFSFALSANTWTKVTKTIPGNTNCQIDNNNGPGLRVQFYQFYGTDFTNNATLNAWSSTNDFANTLPDMASTWITAGASTYDLTGVQIEVGDTATDFEHRSYGDELARCQRYFYRITANNNHIPGIPGAALGPNDVAYAVTFPVTMRATPAYTGSSTAYRFVANDDSEQKNLSDLGIWNTGSRYCMGLLQGSTSSATAGQGGQMQFKADNGFMDFNAEL